MSEYAMKSIREKLCRELDEVARKPDLGAGDLDILHKITDTVKNIDKIEMLEDGDYSRALAVDDTAIPGNRCFGEGDVLPGGDKRRRGVSKFSHWVSPFKKCGGVKCPAAVC